MSGYFHVLSFFAVTIVVGRADTQGIAVKVIAPTCYPDHIWEVSLTAGAKKTVILECKNSRGFVQWTKIGQNSSLSCSPRTKPDCSIRDNWLIIRNIEHTDAGSYVCEDVSTGNKSSPVTIKVTTTPKDDVPLITKPQNQTAAVGSNCTIQFNITNAHSCKFSLNGQGLETGRGLHYDVISMGHLFITSVTPSDDGKYSIVATNLHTHMDAEESLYLTVISQDDSVKNNVGTDATQKSTSTQVPQSASGTPTSSSYSTFSPSGQSVKINNNTTVNPSSFNNTKLDHNVILIMICTAAAVAAFASVLVGVIVCRKVSSSRSSTDHHDAMLTDIKQEVKTGIKKLEGLAVEGIETTLDHGRDGSSSQTDV